MKRNILVLVFVLSIGIIFTSGIFAQNRDVKAIGPGIRAPQSMQERLTIPFSNPAKEKTVSISWQTGDVTINGYTGSEVQVELFEVQDGNLPPKIETGETKKANYITHHPET
ncbi:hypothetical protein ACFL4T_13765 [candidate division KSB1 bacterium]